MYEQDRRYPYVRTRSIWPASQRACKVSIHVTGAGAREVEARASSGSRSCIYQPVPSDDNNPTCRPTCIATFYIMFAWLSLPSSPRNSSALGLSSPYITWYSPCISWACDQWMSTTRSCQGNTRATAPEEPGPCATGGPSWPEAWVRDSLQTSCGGDGG